MSAGYAELRISDKTLEVLSTVEQLDPATGMQWPALPMAVPREGGAACMRPGGTFAVVGGNGADDEISNGSEVFDPGAGSWKLLLGSMASRQSLHALVAVAGGVVATGTAKMAGAADELCDEESGRMPHESVNGSSVISVPASSLPAFVAMQHWQQIWCFVRLRNKP